jgi:hypothetical protein
LKTLIIDKSGLGLPVRAVRAFKLSLLASFCIGEFTLNGELRENDLNPIIRQFELSDSEHTNAEFIMNSLIFLLKAKAFAEALSQQPMPAKLLTAKLHLCSV